METIAPWRRVGERAAVWREMLGISPWMEDVLRRGISDMPTDPYTNVGIMGEIRQGSEDLEFGRKALEKGCGTQELYEELGRDEIDELVKRGYMVSAAFVHWEGTGEDGTRKGRFV